PQTSEYIAGFQDALAGKGDNPWKSGRGFRGGQINHLKRGYQELKSLQTGVPIQRGAGRSPGETTQQRQRAHGDTQHRFLDLPLPSIERRGDRALVVGGIRRVVLAELIETSQSHLLWARQMLPGRFLIEQRSHKPRAMLAPLNNNDWVLRQYTGTSDTW